MFQKHVKINFKQKTNVYQKIYNKIKYYFKSFVLKLAKKQKIKIKLKTICELENF